ncbi:MAG: cytoplasmic protein [Christensenella sp.]|nr:cytoplasmic protein [Christensenella sp.]
MKDIDLIYAHQLCNSNQERLKNAQVCGCFYCLRIFAPKEIIWEDEEDHTAMCPYCGIDSVLPESATLPITKAFLKKMHEFWFTEGE